MKKICVLSGILFAMLVTGMIVKGKRMDMQQCLAQEVFRFHVLANSDSREDQELKLQVKEAVIAYMREELPESDSVEMTRQWANVHQAQIKQRAENMVHEAGYAYPVEVEVTTCDFPDKTYGDVTLPAGRYEALRIEIGEAKGQNWWCVLYPNLCLTEAVHVTETQGADVITPVSRFKIGWFFF